MARVGIRNLTKKFGNTTAVDDLSIDIESGKFIVLLGPSGCGKTTALRCVAGLETPDSGDIFIDDARVTELAPKDRDVAMVFQNYALYPHMSAHDNIAFPLKMRKAPKTQIETRIAEVAKMLNIAELLARKPGQLSGGQQQRIALARALVREPKVFLMDEPLSNLDAKLRLYTRAEIKKLHEEIGVTTIYVTHDQAEAMSMASKIAIMNKGKLIQYDTPLSIYDSPADVFVANFVGSPPMNLIDATVKTGEGGVTLVAETFTYKLPQSAADPVLRAKDKQVLLGIRPENLVLSPVRTPESVFETEVYVYEPLGANTVVDLKVGKDILKSMIQGSFKSRVGDKIWAGFGSDQFHVFESQSGSLLV